MKTVKMVLLIFIIVILLAVAGYLTYVISNGSDPLVLLSSFAQTGTEDDPLDETLLADADTLTPSPTVGFTSTSPSPDVSGTASVSPSPSVSPGFDALSGTTPSPTETLTPTPTETLTPTPSVLPETGGYSTPTPEVTLPVAGVGDYLHPMILGGGILVLLALLL